MAIEYYPLKIVKKEKEAPDSFSFYLSASQKDKNLFYFQPAQFLTLQLEIKGKVFFRSYSIASSPLVEGPLRVTLKRVNNGVVSNYMINHVQEGDTILSQSPAGSFYKLPNHLDENQYVFFGAGVGITPLHSIIKTILESTSKDKILLVYSCKNQNEVIYKKELQMLPQKYKERFKIKWILSQEEGRLDENKLDNILFDSDFTKHSFYLCGPVDYMNMIKVHLKNKNIPSRSIHTEDFKVVPIRGPKPDENSVFFETGAFQEGEPETLKACIYDEEIEIPLDRETSLLEQLLEAGHNPPFSCTSGSCLTCLAKLKEGKVFQIDEGILDTENIKALELLTCQCYPLSKKVVINYDDL